MGSNESQVEGVLTMMKTATVINNSKFDKSIYNIGVPRYL